MSNNLKSSSLPHFLNLPLPPIPSIPSLSSSNSNCGQANPLVFKLTLSLDQFNELLKLDSEVEEGEEGGLRIEFDPNGKGKLHLNSNHSLPLNQPNSGQPRTNRPEEIYSHSSSNSSSSSSTTTSINNSTANPSGSPLTALFRIPIGSNIYDLQSHSSNSTNKLNSTHQPKNPLQSNLNSASSSSYQNKKSSYPTPPDSSQREKEKLAGQRLKEKRLEEDRKKKEKKLIVLDDVPPSVSPPIRKTRSTKSKAISKQQPSTKILKNNGLLSSSSKSNLNSTSSQNSSLNQSHSSIINNPPIPPRRALPGSQSGKQLASEQNHLLLSNPSTPLMRSGLDQSAGIKSDSLHAPTSNFKRSSSSKRNLKVQPHLSPPDSNHLKSAPPSEPQSATKLSTSPGLSSLSEEGDTDHPIPEPLPPLNPKSNSKTIQTSIIPSSKRNEHLQTSKSHSRTAQSKPDSNLQSTTRTAPQINHKLPSTQHAPSKKLSAVPTKPTTVRAIENSQDNVGIRVESTSPSKKRSSETLASNDTIAPSRPKKTLKRDAVERKPLKPPSNSLPPPTSTFVATDEDIKKPSITVRKVAVAPTGERTLSSKRSLETEPSTQPKRFRSDEMGSSLPTIRKVARPAEATINGEKDGAHPNGLIKKVKKKKKAKAPIDYTSSEVEEGEEVDDVVMKSTKIKSLVDERLNKQTQPNSNPILTNSTTSEIVSTTTTNSISKKLNHNKAIPIKKKTIVETGEGEEIAEDSKAMVNYKKNRILFHRLKKHYEFVCERLERFKSGKLRISSLEEIQELLEESMGLENELEKIKNRIIWGFQNH
ncbi:hypothetical protein O181_046530 [Austropuccinia psidii MF-1]|uniref:Uncharacterized protein n=1 Tax=Austropuccinia psidii MF-1 TaxID=1389203 RepID=A0A9Q3HMA2_9BASI|nr:hypothetical protein [Austropuccinia psidii MF-1]